MFKPACQWCGEDITGNMWTPIPPLPQHDLQAEALAALADGYDGLLDHDLPDGLHVQAQDSPVQCRGVDVEPGQGALPHPAPLPLLHLPPLPLSLQPAPPPPPHIPVSGKHRAHYNPARSLLTGKIFLSHVCCYKRVAETLHTNFLPRYTAWECEEFVPISTEREYVKHVNGNTLMGNTNTCMFGTKESQRKLHGLRMCPNLNRERICETC